MRFALIFVSMLMVATPSNASESCMSKAEARQHFGLGHIYWHGADHCWDASVGRRQRQVGRKVELKPSPPDWRDSMSEMIPDEKPARSLWVDRWVDIKPSELPLDAGWVDIPQAVPSPVIELNREPTVPHAVVLLLAVMVIALTLAIIEILFRGTIQERRGRSGM